LLPGSSNANANFKTGTTIYQIERVSGAMDVMAATTTASSAVGTTGNSFAAGTTPASTSGDVVVGTPGVGTNSFVAVLASESSATISSRMTETNGTGYSALYIKAFTASGITSVSPITVVKVTAFIDEQGGQNGLLDPSEWRSSVTITLHPTSLVPVTQTVTQPSKGDTAFTVSATIGALNFSNLNDKFFLGLLSNQNGTFQKALASADKTNVTSSALAGSVVTNRGGVVSESFVVNALTESSSISVTVRYGTETNYTTGVLLATSQFYIVSPLAASGVTAKIVANANATDSGTAATADVRVNNTYTFKFAAISGSGNVSVSGAVLKVGMTSATSLAPGLKSISVNGGASTTSWAGAYSVTTGADGSANFTVATSNFGNGDAFAISASLGNTSGTVTVTSQTASYTLTQDYATLATAPGSAVSATYKVMDQWLVNAPDSATRIFVTKGGTGFAYATTVSTVAVASGVAEFAFTPEAATTTGSATIGAQLQVLNPSTLAYANVGAALSTNVNVSATANTIVKGMKASYSATVSYFPKTVSFTAITGATVANTGSTLVASGAGLIFKDGTGATASETITLRAGSAGAVDVSVTSLLAGTYTLTLTAGASSTTSQIIVAPALSDYGVSITFDTTNIVPGKTRIVTGTVKDANGNPVSTAIAGSTAGDAGTASILVTYAGTAGIPVGALPTETDASGNFQISVLTSATDNGTFTLTATYLPQGAATVTAKKVMVVQTITVGAAASTDQKVTIGTFTGYTAVFVKGYEGKKLSVKLAGKWSVVPSIMDSSAGYYLFKQKTGAGYVANVVVYIDGVMVESMTVTTK
jgi:adhesin/invasin